MGYSMTKKELASIAGYTYRRLYDIDRDLPEGKKLFVAVEGGKKYDLAIFVQKWVEYNVANETCDEMDLEQVKAKHEVVKIQKTELEVARMQGQLVDVQDVRRLWGDIANTVSQNLLHLPSKLAPMLQMVESVDVIRSIIDEEIRKVLEGIADAPIPDYAADAETEDMDEDGEA